MHVISRLFNKLLFIFIQPLCSARNICDALRDFVPFVQFKKREKHPWRVV